MGHIKQYVLRIVRNRVIRNLLSGTIMRLGSYAISFVGVAYLARQLGPEGYGNLNVILAWITYFTILTSLGLPTIGTRDVAQKPEQMLEIWWEVSATRTILSLIAFCLLLVCTDLLPGWDQNRWLFIPYGLGFFANSINPYWVFIGREQIGWSLASGLLQNSLMAAGFIAFVHHPADINKVPWITFVSALASLSIAFIKLALLPKSGRWIRKLPISKMLKLIQVASPVIFGTLLLQIYSNADLLLLSTIKGHKDAGLYSAAYRLISVILTFVSLANQAVFPVMAKTTSNDSERRVVSQNSLTVIFSVFLPMAVGGMLVAGPLVALLFGSSYTPIAPAFQILLWYVLLSSLSDHFRNVLIARQHDKAFLKAIGLGTAINLGLIACLIPLYGTVGAGASMLLAELCVLSYYAKTARKFLGIRFVSVRTLARSAIASVCMAATILIISPGLSLVPVLVISVCVYCCVWGSTFIATARRRLL